MKIDCANRTVSMLSECEMSNTGREMSNTGFTKFSQLSISSKRASFAKYLQ